MKGMFRSLMRASAGQSTVRRIPIAVRAKDIAVADAGAAIGWGTIPLYKLPQGNVLISAAVAYLQFTSAAAGILATFDGDMALGSGATADNALAGTEANIIASTPLGAATAKVSPVVRGAGSTPVLLDNTDASLNLNLNLLIDDASISAASTVTVNGVVYMIVTILGDD